MLQIYNKNSLKKFWTFSINIYFYFYVSCPTCYKFFHKSRNFFLKIIVRLDYNTSRMCNFKVEISYYAIAFLGKFVQNIWDDLCKNYKKRHNEENCMPSGSALPDPTEATLLDEMTFLD